MKIKILSVEYECRVMSDYITLPEFVEVDKDFNEEDIKIAVEDSVEIDYNDYVEFQVLDVEWEVVENDRN